MVGVAFIQKTADSQKIGVRFAYVFNFFSILLGVACLLFPIGAEVMRELWFVPTPART